MKTYLYKSEILLIVLSAIVSGIAFTVDNL